MSDDEAPAGHCRSHRSVLKPAPKGETGRVDAIVMPAARTAEHLLPGMNLAAQLGCEFVALCSGQVQIKEAVGLAHEVPGLSWTLVDLNQPWTSDLLEFRTSRFAAATALRTSDLSAKRNIGLLLARLAGWECILFLDDDITLTADTVREAAATLRPGRATGMRALDFPDNSVVCHALRIVDPKQDVFVSGSALLVDTGRIDSFFPDVYNEDWFFLFDLVRLGGVSTVGEVRQEKYAPFADPERAAREEFGDILAEGLMSLLHYAGGTQRALTEKYWDTELVERRALLGSIVRRLAGSDHPDAPAASAAVTAAAELAGDFTGALLARYVRQWRRDVRLWRTRIDALKPLYSLDEALAWLRLPAVRKESAQPEDQPLLEPGRVPVERLAQAGAPEAVLAVQGARRLVPVQDPQPDPRYPLVPKVRKHRGHQLGADAPVARRRSDPEEAQVAVGGIDVPSGRRADERQHDPRLVDADKPRTAPQFLLPFMRVVTSLLLVRGQERLR